MARKKGPFDAVQFTRESAERIAGVVRQAELTPPAASPLRFNKALQPPTSPSISFAVYTATSNWLVAPYGSQTTNQNTKQIQFMTATGGSAATAMCFNCFAPVPIFSTNATSAKTLVIVSKMHGRWHLIGIQG